MKYSIKQIIFDDRGNRGQIVNVTSDRSGRDIYQILFDKDWETGHADYLPEEKIFTQSEFNKYYK